jgi:hypothetical protein
MNNEESLLTTTELEILNEIVNIAGAPGRLVPVFILKDNQQSALSDLQNKGYVSVSMGNLMVTKMPDILN